jgi:Ca2+-binding EF-hand superfamily protein
MRMTHAFLVLLAGVLILPNLTWSQGPGGVRPGGPGMMGDPGAMFDRFSGGKDVIVVSELDERRRGFFQMFAQRMGLSGERITRDEFKSSMDKFMARMNAGGAAPGGPPMAPPVGGQSPPAGPPTGGPPNSGFNPDRAAEEAFKRFDKNSDGLLSYEELTETMQRERDTWDKNKDGFIDLEEFKAYFAARFAQRQGNNGPVDPRIDAPPPVSADRPAAPEEKRPTIFRAGNLPKELPDWFAKLDHDGDNDGQVGLYEWKTSKKPLDDFLEMDLNGDGFITAEEYLRWKAKHGDKKAGSQGEAIVSAGGENGNNTAPQNGPPVMMGGMRMGGPPGMLGGPPGGMRMGGPPGMLGGPPGGMRMGGPPGMLGGNQGGNMGGDQNGDRRRGGPNGGGDQSGDRRRGGPGAGGGGQRQPRP